MNRFFRFACRDELDDWPEDPPYVHADGGCICGNCGREYRRHPAHEEPYRWLTRLCDGALVKL